MKKSIKVLLITLVILVSANALFAQVSLKMKRPPINQLRAADLYSAIIVNTGEPFTGYLYGSMTNNENGELIATGQTMTFDVKKGTTSFTVSDLPRIPDVSYLAKDPKYKESFMNTGGAPPGDYKICIELRRSNNEVAGEDCIDQKIAGGDAPQLISPGNEEELKIANPVFTWMHMKGPGSDQTYTLKIVELKGDESPENAIAKNKAFFEKEGIREQLFQYPTSAPKFEKGKNYAWMVSIGSVNSGTSVFSLATLDHFETNVLKLECAGNGKYYFEVEVKNFADNNFSSVITQLIVTQPTAITYTITYTAPSASPLPYTLNIGNNTVVFKGTINTTSLITTVKFNVKQDRTYSDGTTNLNYNQPAGPFNSTKQCGCCDGMTKIVQVLGLNATSTPGAYKLDLKLTAGPSKIKKVVGYMSYFGWRQSNEACKKCVNSSVYWGNINSVPSPTLAGFPTIAFTPSGTVNSYSHEVTWLGASVNMSAGIPVSMYVMFPAPSSLSCCPDTIDFCMRFEFTDSACVTCDTTFCFRQIRTTTTTGGPKKIIDEKLQIEKLNEEIEKEDPGKDDEEFKKGKEMQDEIEKKRKGGESQGHSNSGLRSKYSNQKNKGKKK